MSILAKLIVTFVITGVCSFWAVLFASDTKRTETTIAGVFALVLLISVVGFIVSLIALVWQQ